MVQMARTPEQLAAEQEGYLRRRRLAYRIVLGALSVWAGSVIVSLALALAAH